MHLCSMYGKPKSTIFSILKDKEKFMEAKVSTGITWLRVIVNLVNQLTGCLPAPPGYCPDTLQRNPYIFAPHQPLHQPWIYIYLLCYLSWRSNVLILMYLKKNGGIFYIIFWFSETKKFFPVSSVTVTHIYHNKRYIGTNYFRYRRIHCRCQDVLALQIWSKILQKYLLFSPV